MPDQEDDFNMQPVTSSQISAVGYNEPRKQLAVQFSNGSLYTYDGVEFALYGEMMAAPSVGSFFHQRVKNGGYSYTKVS